MGSGVCAFWAGHVGWPFRVRALGLRSLGFKGSVGRSRLTASGCRVSSGPRLRRIQAARCLSVSLDFEVTRERKV